MTERFHETRLWAFVGVVALLGAAALALSAIELGREPLSPGFAILAFVTMVSGRFRIKVPGHSASVSVSEVFVFATVLLYGPGPATLLVAVDGLLISVTQTDRRLYRALFNIGEPAISTFLAAHAFFATSKIFLGLSLTGPSVLIAPTMVMAATYFAANSTLTAMAVAVEGGKRVATVWRSHALYLAMNYYAAASVAVLVFKSDTGINVGVVGLVAPLLALSYAAYKAAASRVEDTKRHLREVEHLYQATVETLAIAVDAKDQVTHGHIRRVQRHTVATARILGVSDPVELRALEAASLLHDVGKLAIPDYVLNKPAALSRDEFELMKQHAAKGAEILTAVEFPYAVVPVVRHHHEQWDGKGYPDGLAGESIPFGARVLTVVDCFDAVTSDRPYRRKMTDEQGIEILRARSGTMYDPHIVDAFVALIPALRAEDHKAEAATAPKAKPQPAPVGIAVRPTVLHAADFEAQSAAVAFDRLKKLLPGAEGCLFIPGKDGLVVACGTPRMSEVASTITVPMGHGLAGWIAVNRHTIVNSHADLDLGVAAAALGLQACTATPIFVLGDLIGVLSVYLPKPRRFSESDARAVGALAQEIGLELAQKHFALATPRATQAA